MLTLLIGCGGAASEGDTCPEGTWSNADDQCHDCSPGKWSDKTGLSSDDDGALGVKRDEMTP